MANSSWMAVAAAAVLVGPACNRPTQGASPANANTQGTANTGVNTAGGISGTNEKANNGTTPPADATDPAARTARTGEGASTAIPEARRANNVSRSRTGKSSARTAKPGAEQSNAVDNAAPSSSKR